MRGARGASKRNGWNVYTRGGRDDEGIDAVEWARRGEELGAGEILLTSMDTDGVQTGFDCALTRAVREATSVPVIASGGAGKPEDFFEVFQHADAALAASIFHYRDLHGRRSQELSGRAGNRSAPMIIPCIDLMGGKVVQLVQGRDKALEGDAPLEMLRKFSAFPEIQVIDLDAAMGKGENGAIVELLSSRAKCRVGGGVRNAERASTLIAQGAHRVIVGTAAFTPALEEIAAAIGPERVIIALDSKGGKVVVNGWQEATDFTAIEVIHRLEPFCSGFLCTYVDSEGMMQGTDLDWFRSLRAATSRELTAAGGITTFDEIRQLAEIRVHAALGMAIYTGRLSLESLADLKDQFHPELNLPRRRRGRRDQSRRRTDRWSPRIRSRSACRNSRGSAR